MIDDTYLGANAEWSLHPQMKKVTAAASSKATAAGGKEEADALGAGWLEPVLGLTWGAGLLE